MYVISGKNPTKTTKRPNVIYIKSSSLKDLNLKFHLGGSITNG